MPQRDLGLSGAAACFSLDLQVEAKEFLTGGNFKVSFT